MQYRDGLNGKPEPANEVIDLKMGATAREARDTDRRFGEYCINVHNSPL